jgi:predicted DNA-binding transcriptional regulator YafY
MGIWDGRVIEFEYQNHRGVVEQRRVVPTGIVFETSDYYPLTTTPQWYVVAWDLDRQAERRFMWSRIAFVDQAEDQSLPWRKT